ncbi:TolC family protein [Pedobacter frigoris]|uniref:TolC family protein n=1 Tax=Pedobacter frigoris TaxID=2571272 RepID=A0A4U1CQY8_9SPHI|nr:TolC family protein [Pedobacter frigoris]TKC09320.1 TolC family protein [Pedobacter frigoris]
MNNNKSSLLSFLIFLLSITQLTSATAQESVLSEVSNLYLEKLIAAAKANYPRVRNFDSQINIAKSDVTAAKISWLDPFSFQYVTRSDNSANTVLPNVRTSDFLTGYQVGITFNPGQFLAKPSAVRKAKEQVKLAESNQAEYFLQLESLVKSRYFLYVQYQKSLLPVTNAYNDAESSFKSIKTKYQKGEATFLEFNSASTALNQAIQTKLQVEASYLSAKASLEELTVIRLENIK